LICQKLICWTRRRKIVGSIGAATRQHLPLPEQDFVILPAVESRFSRPEPSFDMSANDSALAQQQCPRCAQPMKLIRRTRRFGGLADLCTSECAACDITLIEECKPTVRHVAEVYRKQAKACRELATQAQGDDRTFWIGLSDCWLKLAQVHDEQKH
jgi:hypothetical protein